MREHKQENFIKPCGKLSLQLVREVLFFMREIVLNIHNTTTSNHRKYIALVDDDDFIKVSQHKWNVAHAGTNIYAGTTIINNKKKSSIRMHRFIMGCSIGDGRIIDHKDGNGLNNQKSNLRECNLAQNGANRRPKRNGTSKYLGVSLHKTKKTYFRKSTQTMEVSHSTQWQSAIRLSGKSLYLGSFNNEEEAALSYNEAAKKYHGEFARLNIIPQKEEGAITPPQH